MNQATHRGITIITVVIAVAVILGMGAVVYGIMTKSQVKNEPVAMQSTSGRADSQPANDSANSGFITWEYMGDEWRSSQKTAACPEPFVFESSPADLTKASHVLYPGQLRGGNYKPHGGFRFEGVINNEVTVVAPHDAYVVRGSRYIEQGEVQYMFDFQLPCGKMYRLDHLHTLTGPLVAIANQFPVPKVDDSRTTKVATPVKITAGTKLATVIGFLKTNNASFDLGVYDLTKKNAATSDAAWLAKRGNELELASYGVCWFDLLPEADAAKTKRLPAGDAQGANSSDYCK